MKREEIIETIKGLLCVITECRTAVQGQETEWNDLVMAGHTAIDSLTEQLENEKVPDLSGLEKKGKDEFINEFVEMTAKNVLSVFVALGLKTHLEATVINDADGNCYKLSFHNIEFHPAPGFEHLPPDAEDSGIATDHTIITPEISEEKIEEPGLNKDRDDCIVCGHTLPHRTAHGGCR